MNELRQPMPSRLSKWRFNVRWGLLAVASLLIVLLGGAACASQDSDATTEFSLTSSQGQEISLNELVQQHDRVVIVFYRGYF